MDNTFLMGGDQGIGQLQAEGNDLAFRQGTCREHDVHRRAGNIFRDQKTSFVFFVEVEDSSNVGMIELGESKRFFTKPFYYAFVRKCISWQDFYGYIALQPLVIRQENHAHPARANLLL